MTVRARARKTSADREEERNLYQRQQAALDLLSQGYNVPYIMAKCGFKSRSQARHALQVARKSVAEDTAEEQRLNFKASYAQVRQALHNLARRGDVRAVEALVKLDERECRLFGLDLQPGDALLQVQYTKRIVIEESGAPVESPHVEEIEA